LASALLFTRKGVPVSGRRGSEHPLWRITIELAPNQPRILQRMNFNQETVFSDSGIRPRKAAKPHSDKPTQYKWLAPHNRCACRSQNGLASSQSHDENRWERKSKQPYSAAHRTETPGRKVRAILAHSYRLESTKRSGDGGSVSLDFPFYRTYQELAVITTLRGGITRTSSRRGLPVKQ
jgi:hypothetical protein